MNPHRFTVRASRNGNGSPDDGAKAHDAAVARVELQAAADRVVAGALATSFESHSDAARASETAALEADPFMRVACMHDVRASECARCQRDEQLKAEIRREREARGAA